MQLCLLFIPFIGLIYFIILFSYIKKAIKYILLVKLLNSLLNKQRYYCVFLIKFKSVSVQYFESFDNCLSFLLWMALLGWNFKWYILIFICEKYIYQNKCSFFAFINLTIIMNHKLSTMDTCSMSIHILIVDNHENTYFDTI